MKKGFHAIHCLEPGCGQSEIRTRGRLPFNGFQDRLFRPLRHLSSVHNARNVNIAQHSEIIRIATRKSASSVAKCRPTIPKPTQRTAVATVREYPTNPSIPKTTQHDPNASIREYLANPSIPKPTQRNPNASVREYPTNPSIPKTTQTGEPPTRTTRCKAQQPSKRYSNRTHEAHGSPVEPTKTQKRRQHHADAASAV